MNYENTVNDLADRSGVKSKSTWFSAEDVCILADLVRSHSDALRNLSNSPSRNEKRKVWDVIAQLLAEKTKVARTTRQVQKKWSNLRSAVRRASRTSVGTSVLPHYFLPVVKYLEEESTGELNITQEFPDEEIDVTDVPQNLEDEPSNRRQTYAVKIRRIQEQQKAEEENLAVLRHIKLETIDYDDERGIPEVVHHEEDEQELEFTHVTLPGTENVHSNIEHLESGHVAPVWLSDGNDNNDVVTELSESEDVYFQERQGRSRRNFSAARKRPRPWADNEERNEGETRQMKTELLKAQLLLVQKETAVAEREIIKRDKEISLLDKEIMKVDLEIKIMKRRHMWEEMRMGME